METIVRPARPRRPPQLERRRRRRRRAGWVALALLGLAVAAGAAVYVWSGASLTSDPAALARVSTDPFAGRIVRITASTATGRPVPLRVASGTLTPRSLLKPGERITVAVTIERPGWSAWLLGAERHEQLTVTAPTASLRARWLSPGAGSRPLLRFDRSVSVVEIGSSRVTATGASVPIPSKAPSGSVQVRVAARAWERLGPPVRVTWFPPAAGPVVLASPGPGAELRPMTPLRLTFSVPVARALGSARPTLSPRVPGRWEEADDHTLVFHPSGFGAPFDGEVHVGLTRALAVAAIGKPAAKATSSIRWPVAPAAFLRLQQLLAEQGYLPVRWQPAAPEVGRTAVAETTAAVDPPGGHFSWRYPNTPSELERLWTVGKPNTITRGAVMMFQDEHHLAVDGIAGKQVWRAILADAVAGKHRTAGYSYVYVHRNVPQLLTLWHNGRVVLTSPGNTGVPAAPTTLGTFPVFEHIPVGRMSGTNPDGSHYDDPGIRWISYFHGGEALHAFNRASFGTPQSLGCVELPLASAAKVWPYTPIGTLVTIED